MRADPSIADAATVLSGTGDPETSSDRVAPGVAAGDYRIDRFLGGGAMGDVYAGTHPVIGKKVAIKVIKRHLAGSPDAVERFLREARAVNQVGHPNVIDVFAVGRLDDGRLYLVMDLLEGESLGARLRRGRPSVDEALAILEQVAAALDAAHARGVVHRDLKPDNVFLSGDDARVHVLDFGIAKLLATGTAAPLETLTDRGTWLGTPAYMAPEQWGSDGAGPASDRYALGIMAFELLSGRVPFTARTLPQMMEQHFRAPVPTIIGEGRGLPAAVDRVLTCAMAKDPDERYPSGKALVADLRAALGRGRVQGTGARAPRRTSALVLALGAATAVAGTVTAVIVLRGGRDRGGAPPAPSPAVGQALDVSTTPPGARVRIAGVDRGATPMSVEIDGDPAEVMVTLAKPGYAPVTRAAGGQRLHVALTPVVQFEGVWSLPDGALRAFQRDGERVAMYTLEAVGASRRLERHFEFVAADLGLVTFVASEDHVDPRAPDEPSCHHPLRAEYSYDLHADALRRRMERIQLDLTDGHCVVAALEWGEPVELRRVAHASDSGTWAESTAGSGNPVAAPEPPPAQEEKEKAQKPQKKAPPRKRPPQNDAKDAIPPPQNNAPAPVDPADTQQLAPQTGSAPAGKNRKD
jgi:hypothetical protein